MTFKVEQKGHCISFWLQSPTNYSVAELMSSSTKTPMNCHGNGRVGGWQGKAEDTAIREMVKHVRQLVKQTTTGAVGQMVFHTSS